LETRQYISAQMCVQLDTMKLQHVQTKQTGSAQNVLLAFIASGALAPALIHVTKVCTRPFHAPRPQIGCAQHAQKNTTALVKPNASYAPQNVFLARTKPRSVSTQPIECARCVQRTRIVLETHSWMHARLDARQERLKPPHAQTQQTGFVWTVHGIHIASVEI